MSSSPIAVSGSIAYDYLSRYDQPFQDVLLADKLHELSVCFVVSEREKHFGGTAGNITYNLSLLEQPSIIFAGVGHDFGEYEKHLKKRRVDMSPLRVSKDISTASATIISDPNGNQISEFFPGAMGRGLKPYTKKFSESGLLIISPDSPTWMLDYAAQARHLGLPYFFDPGQGIPGFSGEDLVSAVDGSEGLFLNDYEFELFKAKTKLDVEEILKLTRVLIITHGENGSMIYSGRETLEIPVVKTSRAVNPTGCGDAYRAAFLLGYLEEYGLETCGQMGALLASYCVEYIGTQHHETNWRKFSKDYAKTFGSEL